MQDAPQKIDKYQILSVLGKGAMGVVYHAYDPVVKRDVALKFLSSLGSDETELISRFEREARLAGGLRHPNIVTIYDLGHFEGRPYIVMEYIVGRDLQAVIKHRQNLSFEQKVEILLQICKGLDAAHQKGIIHRDIKPANIRLQEDNTLKIMDFGIARMGTSQLTRSGYIIGTLQYMSPEQISGEQLDPRTDIFSSGVIGYELFTYNNPFNGEHTVDIMYRILNVRPQPVQDLPEEFGTELNQIIMRALEKNRDLRYPSAKEMGQDLEEYLFYLKSLKFRQKVRRAPTFVEGVTQTLPLDELSAPPPPSSETEIAATVIAPSDRGSEKIHRPVRDPEIPPTVLMTSAGESATPLEPPPPSEIRKTTRTEADKIPSYGQSTAERAPRTGIGANYSETGRVLISEPSFWQKGKFYILGGLLALLFVGGMIFTGTIMNRDSGASLPLQSSPAGAEVSIDGQHSGQTPLTVQLKEKKDMTVSFHLAGYQDKSIDLKKDAWPSQLSVSLEPSSPVVQERAIKVETTPAGASVTMDGRPIGKSPVEVKPGDAAAHRIALELDGYQKVEQTIDAKTPETLTVTLQPSVQPGTIRYAGSYPVSLSVDGKPVRGTSVDLSPGTYTVTLRTKKGAFIRNTQTVEVKSSETATVRAPAMGTLTVKANPSRCKISIDGEFVDLVPIIKLPVQAGNHVVQFNWEMLEKKKSQPVRISADQNETIVGVPE